MGAQRPFGFPKAARLRRRPEFLAVKATGAGFADGPLACSVSPREPAPTRLSAGRAPAVARVGLAVSTKVGNSVARNTVKRRLREAIRLELDALPAVDLVLVARASSVNASVVELRSWLRRAAKRFSRAKGPA